MTPRPGETDAVPGLAEAFGVWFRIGVTSFGGPAGQIALMHRMVVEQRRWIDEARFLHALNYCMLLPGPEAQQLATYIGWLMHRTVGGLTAGLLFILPGALVMLGLSIAYVLWSGIPLIEAAFTGVKAAVLIIVVEAVVRIARRALHGAAMVAVSAGAFVAIFAFAVPFPAIIVAAALIGFLAGLVRSGRDQPQSQPHDAAGGTVIDRLQACGRLDHTRPRAGRSFMLLAVFAVLWFLPVALLVTGLGPDHVFAQQAVFFSKLAVVTFGGAYAVLAYMAQQAVDAFGWLTPQQMLDGLGLAETTPGPLILVTQFVGFLGAWRAGAADPIWSGVLGTCVTLWVTFTPCFLWIFLGAPWIEHLRGNRHMTAALSGITAAVVGVVLNLAIWFGLHVTFRELVPAGLPGVSFAVPVLESVELANLGLTVLAGVLLLGLRQGLLRTLAACAAAGMLVSLV